jgi:hypothetical protein
VRPPESSAEAKVSKLDVPLRVDQDVVGFDVAVDKPHVVHGLHGARQFGNVKPGK